MNLLLIAINHKVSLRQIAMLAISIANGSVIHADGVPLTHIDEEKKKKIFFALPLICE